LIGKARIALGELDIGNVSVHLFLFANIKLTYNYTKGAPVRYTNPSGHMRTGDQCSIGGCYRNGVSITGDVA
jgi:hypothetical protein